MTNEGSNELYMFNILTPLGFFVHTTEPYWNYIITIKHPAMAKKLAVVIDTLQHPVEIRNSKIDSSVFLFYKQEEFKRWICSVVKRDNNDGFLITAYPTDNIKEGDKIWPR